MGAAVLSVPQAAVQIGGQSISDLGLNTRFWALTFFFFYIIFSHMYQLAPNDHLEGDGRADAAAQAQLDERESVKGSIQLQEAEVDVSDKTKIALKYPDDFIVDRCLKLP